MQLIRSVENISYTVRTDSFVFVTVVLNIGLHKPAHKYAECLPVKPFYDA